MEKEALKQLVKTRVPSVMIDTSIPQKMQDRFAILKTIPYKAKDFDDWASSETTTEEETLIEDRTVSAISYKTGKGSNVDLFLFLRNYDY